jgi:hypothetical protein
MFLMSAILVSADDLFGPIYKHIAAPEQLGSRVLGKPVLLAAARLPRKQLSCRAMMVFSCFALMQARLPAIRWNACKKSLDL